MATRNLHAHVQQAAAGTATASVWAPRLERYGHALAGLAVAACGLLVVAGL